MHAAGYRLPAAGQAGARGPAPEGIAASGRRARALVGREFTFERAVERWRKILEEVANDGR